MRLYALTLMPAETREWEDVSAWSWIEGRLYIRFTSGMVVMVELPSKYIGVYDDDPRPALSRKTSDAPALAKKIAEESFRRDRRASEIRAPKH